MFSGPSQLFEARMAAIPPTRFAPEPLFSSFTWHSPVCYCLFLSKLGNERIACAVLCCNYVEPNATRPPVSQGRQVCALHRLAFLPIAGATAHTAASHFLATSSALGST